jgi:orotate phosphoribosyltransferase
MLATRTIPESSIVSKKRRLLEIIKKQSLLREKEWLLASGARSNYYFDMKQTTFDPEGISLTAEILFDRIRDLRFDYIGGLETGAIPIVAAVSACSWPERPIKSFFVRDEAKNHGTKKLIDGFMEDGATVIIIDDVTTKGDSSMKAVRAVHARGCKVLKVIAIVDRLEGAAENYARQEIPFEAIFDTRDFD